MEINFITQIWQDGKMFVAYSPELDVSSCGKTLTQAQKNLYGAVEIFLEETNKMGTIDDVLTESGFIKEQYNHKIRWQAPKIISTGTQRVAI